VPAGIDSTPKKNDYPGSKLVIPKILSKGRKGTAPEYNRAVPKTICMLKRWTMLRGGPYILGFPDRTCAKG
jgi:hypothetical protein